MEAREKGSHPSGWVRMVVVKMSPIKKRDKQREESEGGVRGGVRGRSQSEGGAGCGEEEDTGYGGEGEWEGEGKLGEQSCQSTQRRALSGKHDMWPRAGGDRDRAASIPLSIPCVLVTHLHSCVRHTVFLPSLRPLLSLCPPLHKTCPSSPRELLFIL